MSGSLTLTLKYDLVSQERGSFDGIRSYSPDVSRKYTSLREFQCLIQISRAGSGSKSTSKRLRGAKRASKLFSIDPSLILFGLSFLVSIRVTIDRLSLPAD